MKQLFALLLAFLATAFHLQAAIQTIHFDISVFGNKVGVMTVTRDERPGGIEFYTLSEHSKAKIFWSKREETTQYEVTYKDGLLISSMHKEYVNGKLHRWTNITQHVNVYQVDSYKGKRTFTEAPVYSNVTIYFKDIRNVKRIFDESEADFDAVEHPQSGTVLFKSSNGYKNIYHFVNGQIKDAEIKFFFASVKIVRTD